MPDLLLKFLALLKVFIGMTHREIYYFLTPSIP